MPATRSHEGTWNPPPFITGGHRVRQEFVDKSYFPLNRQACIDYILAAGVPEIDAYNGLENGPQTQIADEIARQIYDVDVEFREPDLSKALAKYMSEQQSLNVPGYIDNENKNTAEPKSIIKAAEEILRQSIVLEPSVLSEISS